MKLLIVEDNNALSALLSDSLTNSGFSVDVASYAQEALSMVSSSHYNLIILDLGLPDKDGIDVLKHLRSKSLFTNPCLILSARDALQSRIDGLDAGADDYLIKPFDIAELQARLRALLRRPKALEDDIITVGNLILSPLHGHASIDKISLQLARKEHLLLCELAKKVNWVVIKNQLEDRLYSFNEESSPNAVEAVVSRVRRKLANHGASCEIETIRGLGYRLMKKHYAT